MFVAEFLAVGKRSAFRSLPGAALRSALGCKNVAAAGGASAVQSFKRRKTKGRACWFLHAACGGSVSSVWFLSEWAHLCGVGLPGQVRGFCVRTGAG